MEKKRGFTLVELLVVISIIALLLAILLPTLGRAREAGRNIQCMSNMHNIAIALALYAANNDDKLPYGSAYVTFNDQHWMPALATYLGIKRNSPNWERKKWWGDVHPLAMDKPFKEAIYCPTGYRAGRDMFDFYGEYGCLYGTGGLPYLSKRGTERPASASRMSNKVFVIGEGGKSIFSPIDEPFIHDISGSLGKDSADGAKFRPYGELYPYNLSEPMRHPGGANGGHANYSFADGSARRSGLAEWESGSGLWKLRGNRR